MLVLSALQTPMQYDEMKNTRTTCSCTRWIHDAKRAMTAVTEQNLNRNIKRTNRRVTDITLYTHSQFMFIVKHDEIKKTTERTTKAHKHKCKCAEHCWFFEKPASRVKRCCVCFGDDNKKTTNQPKPNGKTN